MTIGRLAATTITVGTDTPIYTAPPGVATLCKLRLNNQNPQAVKLRLAVGPGSAPQSPDYLTYDMPWPANGVANFSQFSISGGETVWVNADFGTVSAQVIGIEQATSANMPLPSLDLAFAASRAPDPRLTCVRAGAATAWNANGVLVDVAPYTQRIDFDPATKICKGLLVEDASTNLIRNNTMQGAAVGTPGTLPTTWGNWTNSTGLTTQVVAIGNVFGLDYIDIRVSGTGMAGTAWDIDLDLGYPAVTTGATYTFSIFAAQIAGSTNNVLWHSAAIASYAGATWFAESNFIIAPTSAALNSQRYARQLTIAATVTKCLPYYRVALAGGPVDFTIRLALPQLELGANPSSPIRTSGAAVSRAADVITLPTGPAWLNPAQGTVYTEMDSVDAPLGSWPRAFCLSDGTTANQVQIVQNGGGNTVFTEVFSGGVGKFGSTFNNYTGQAAKFALAWAVGSAAIAKDGLINPVGAPSAVPVGLTKLSVGSDNANAQTSFLNGHIARLCFWQARLPDAQIQILSSIGVTPPDAGRLGAADLYPGVDTALYVVPALKLATLSVHVCSRTASTVRVRLAHTTGAQPVAADYAATDIIIPGNGVFNDDTGIFQSGMTIWARTDTAGVNVRAYGFSGV